MMADEKRQRGLRIDPSVIARVSRGSIMTGGARNDRTPGNTPDDWMGPGSPLGVSAPAFVKGRAYDFPVGVNTWLSPRQGESVSYDILRGLAERYDLLRLAIETRKDQLSKLQWTIQAREGATVPEARLKELIRFFRRPDREHTWDPWYRGLLEDLLVVDAPCIWPRNTLKGDLYALEWLDGATISRKIGEDGRTPEPPDVAYQQIIKGAVAADYTRDELIFRPRNVRTHRLYGFSPVEQVVMTVNIGMRRQLHQLQYYTEGNIPEALIGVPATWQPHQIQAFQEYWDWLLAGDTAARRHARFIPGGMTVVQTKEGALKDEFDEYLARVICYAFSLPPTAFVKQMNRATAQQANESAQEEGLLPIMTWTKDLMDEIIEFRLLEPDAEFVWKQERQLDAKVQAEIDEIYVRIGVRNPADISEERGFEPVEVKPETATQAAPQTGAAAGTGAPESDATAATAGDDLKKADDRGMKTLPPLDLETPLYQRSVSKLTRMIQAVFSDAAADLAGQVVALSKKLQKADDDLIEEIIQSLDFSGWAVLAEDSADILETVCSATGARAVAQVGFSDSYEALHQTVDARALEFARTRGAEYVGMLRQSDGSLLPDPNPKRAITDATREMLRADIADAVEQGLSVKDLTAKFQESAAFGEARARTIAQTELLNASAEGAWIGYQASGVQFKRWFAGNEGESDDGLCDACQLNEDAGVIPMDDAFPSGHMHPVAHPHCRCAFCAVVAKDPDEAQDEKS